MAITNRGTTQKSRRLQVHPAKPQVRLLPAMSIRVTYRPLPVLVSLEKSAAAVLFRFNPADSRLEPDEPEAYSFREMFLDIKTPAEALDFFSVAGYFQFPQDVGQPQTHEVLTWADFQVWQEIIRQVLLTGPLTDKTVPNGVDFDVPEGWIPTLRRASFAEEMWLMGHPDGISIAAEPPGEPGGRPTLEAEITVHSILEAMLAACYIDSLHGVQRSLCALSDCNTLYEVSSNHKREYCSQACAHKASVRRKRRELKESSLKP